MPSPNTNIPEKVRTSACADLNVQLAHLLDLAACAKQAHWNVAGANFAELHGLFDAIAAQARDHADAVAERALALGALAHGTVQDVGSKSTFPPFPTNTRNWLELTTALRERAAGCAAKLRESAERIADEPVTQDLYIGMIAEIEKSAWMLGAHLEH